MLMNPPSFRYRRRIDSLLEKHEVRTPPYPPLRKGRIGWGVVGAGRLGAFLAAVSTAAARTAWRFNRLYPIHRFPNRRNKTGTILICSVGSPALAGEKVCD